jgi:hypothetical protein
VLTYIASLENIIRLSAFAKYGSIQSQTIFIDLLVPSPYHALPTTNDFFIRNSAGYIEGYSTSFITACNNDENLNTYLTAHGADLNANILDLSNDKVSGKQFALSPKLPGQSNIANFYSRIKRIYLDNTTFGWNGIGAICNSGYYSFSTDDYINRLNCFSNLEAIYMRGSNFCDNQNIVIGQYTNISSACQTFANLLLPALKTIVIDNTIFACSNMVDNLSTDTNDIVLNTADSTFINCQMQALTSLEIDHCIFATENMAVTSTPKVINTAISTLGSCVLDNLDSLTISNNIYAARNMGNCELSTAVGTFANCSSNNLTSLSLNNECFSVMHMIPDGSNGTLDTAKITFANCLFPNLKTVDLSTSVFAATGAGTHYLLDRYAYMTFVNTNFDSSGQSVGVSDLYLPQNPKQPDGLGDVVSIYS